MAGFHQPTNLLIKFTHSEGEATLNCQGELTVVIALGCEVI